MDSTGEVQLSLMDESGLLKGKNILVVEDIVDTGKTMNRLSQALREVGVASMEVCALIRKQGVECEY